MTTCNIVCIYYNNHMTRRRSASENVARILAPDDAPRTFTTRLILTIERLQTRYHFWRRRAEYTPEAIAAREAILAEHQRQYDEVSDLVTYWQKEAARSHKYTWEVVLAEPPSAERDQRFRAGLDYNTECWRKVSLYLKQCSDIVDSPPDLTKAERAAHKVERIKILRDREDDDTITIDAETFTVN